MGSKRLAPIARKLRRDMTDAERLLWSRPRESQLDGQRSTTQFPIGTAVADFACRSANMMVELDGGQHAIGTEADTERTSRMEAHGYTIIRFWNNDVIENLNGVLETILANVRIARNR